MIAEKGSILIYCTDSNHQLEVSFYCSPPIKYKTLMRTHLDTAKELLERKKALKPYTATFIELEEGTEL